MHQDIELLAPAGGPDQLRAALAGGADAIFCGLGHHFNARRGATSFDDETFAEGCRQAHLAGARVYVTVNVVIKADEMARALALVRRAWLLGADAFIVQDWGLLDALHRQWGELELHISTQANVHDARGVAWVRDRYAVPRVTLSRELSLPEIARIAQEGVELEGFAHGALCFSYSGVCMMSVLSGDRSANRGACAQPCRLPYDLVDAEDTRLSPANVRPLCPKDYRTIERLDELAAAGLASLKIEGRLKGPDYVHAVVRAYRAALDERQGRQAEVDGPARERLLRRVFNRDFTSSYLDGHSDNAMMSYERSNNRGELVGRVSATRDLGSRRVWRGGTNGGRERTRKQTVAEVDVILDAPVGKGDLLELRPDDNPAQFLTAHASRDAAAGETITCRTARPMPQGCPVRVIRSQEALDAGERAARRDVARQRPVRVCVTARKGEPFCVELSCTDGAARASASGFVVEPARSRAVTEEELIAHVGRMGNASFVPVSFDVDLDEGCGMRFADVHKVRTAACRALEHELLAPYEERSLTRAPRAETLTQAAEARLREIGQPAWQTHDVEVCALVSTPAAAAAARAAGAQVLYATADDLATHDWGGDAPYPWLDEVCREGDHERQDRWAKPGARVGVGNVSELALAVSQGALPEVRPCIPVHNLQALATLAEAGAAGIWISAEMTLAEACVLAQASPVPAGAVVYGRTRAMTSEHCVLQVAGRCVHDCARCPVRSQDLALVDGKGRRYPVRTDLAGRSRIYAAEPLDAAPEVAELVSGGIRRLLVDGTLLAPQELGAAVARIADALRRAGEGQAAPERLPGHTSGHLHRPID